MDELRFLVRAVVAEGRSPTEIARAHRVSRSWLYELIARYRQGGDQALQPRSKRPHSCAHQVEPKVAETIVRIRQELLEAGHDGGPHTIAHHLRLQLGQPPPSPATIWRILRRRGLVTPQPHKRPRSSFVRFQADLPNQLWQADATDWLLADGSRVEILNFEDDHSRLFLASTAFYGQGRRRRRDLLRRRQ